MATHRTTIRHGTTCCSHRSNGSTAPRTRTCRSRNIHQWYPRGVHQGKIVVSRAYHGGEGLDPGDTMEGIVEDAMDMTMTTSPISMASDRVARLEIALTLRKLYRNLLRAETMLKFPCPVYEPDQEGEGKTKDGEGKMSVEEMDAERKRKIDEAVDYVAELELTADEMRLILSTLKAQSEDISLLFPDVDPKSVITELRDHVKSMYKRLVDRLTKELPYLPFPSVAAAQAEIESRNAVFRVTPISPGGLGPELGGYQTMDEDGDGDQRQGLLKTRLGKAERFVSRNLQPAVAKVRESSPQSLIEGFQDLWKRLNGTGGDVGADVVSSALQLPFPNAVGKDAEVLEFLHDKIVELESQLQEASKVRENRVRKTDIPSRAKIASELRKLDEQVTILSRELAIRTLQLEMEWVYECLESEAMDILGDPSVSIGSTGEPSRLDLALSRRGSTDEIALFTAEYKELATSLAILVDASVKQDELLFIDEYELATLATEIPDLRMRLGIGDEIVFGVSGFSLNKLQFQTRQAINTVKEGILFGGRGVRLLSGDVGAAVRLFWRALLGGTLKPREVAALRRTAKDLLTFIPFIIILILPLTPVGHVLIFGFIQRYFPGFFPSQFTSRRQDLMIKYEELKRQLTEAQIKAEEENDEIEFRKMAAAAEAILAQTGREMGARAEMPIFPSLDPSSSTSSGSVGTASIDEEDFEGPAAEAVKELEKKVAAAEDESFTEVDD